jgi:hypothetical protein
MLQQYKNLCYRCGKERVVTRVWKEQEGNSIIENTETKCPDVECQKINEKEMEKQHARRMETEERKRQSVRNRRPKMAKT